MIVLYKVLAAVIAIMHSLVALYMLSILYCVFKKKLPGWYLKIQVIIIGISCVFNLTSGVCPLTFIENKLRALGREQVYKGNFLNYYAQKFLNFPLSDQVIFNSITLFLLLLIYMIVIQWVRLKKAALV